MLNIVFFWMANQAEHLSSVPERWHCYLLKATTVEPICHIVVSILCSWIVYEWAWSIATIRCIHIAVNIFGVSFIIRTIVAFLILIIYATPIVWFLARLNFAHCCPRVVWNYIIEENVELFCINMSWMEKLFWQCLLIYKYPYRWKTLLMIVAHYSKQVMMLIAASHTIVRLNCRYYGYPYNAICETELNRYMKMH